MKFKMENHRFKYAGIINNRKVYIIECNKTGGEFCTEHWNKGLIEKNFCPCCNNIIISSL